MGTTVKSGGRENNTLIRSFLKNPMPMGSDNMDAVMSGLNLPISVGNRMVY